MYMVRMYMFVDLDCVSYLFTFFSWISIYILPRWGVWSWNLFNWKNWRWTDNTIFWCSQWMVSCLLTFFHLFLCTIFYEFWITFLFCFYFRLLVEGKLAQFKSEERIRLLTALKNYNEALMERATLLDKNSRLSRHNAELKMLLNLDNN